MRQHYPLNSNGAEDAGQLPWADGVPSTGVQGSYPGHAIVTDAEAEILAAIDASGQARNGADLAQVAVAIGRGIYLGQLGGAANALTAAIPNNVVFSSLLRGLRFGGFVTTTNTGGVTLALVGIGGAASTVTAPILRKDGSALQAGDLPIAQDFEVRWDGSAFRYVGAVTSETPAQSPIGKGLYSKQAAGSYTWTVPAGVYWTYATCVGGGGGGSGGLASGAATAGAGGGAGGTAAGWLAVTPGQAIPFVVGAGGAGQAYQTPGYAGGTSSVGSVLQAQGGFGATNGTATAGGGGGVGYGSACQVPLVGGNGGDGNFYTASAPGGSGGQSSLGGGGRPATFYNAGTSNGRAPGSGGGGLYGNGGTGPGGTGADGYVSFQY